MSFDFIATNLILDFDYNCSQQRRDQYKGRGLYLENKIVHLINK